MSVQYPLIRFPTQELTGHCLFGYTGAEAAITMAAMKIALGADHAGFELKQDLHRHLRERGIDVQNLGTDSSDSCDYPDFARKVAAAISEGEAEFGVLVCGTGIGMAIAANKVPGIRAANCHLPVEAQLAREHNNANILTLGARTLDPATAVQVLDAFLQSRFSGGERHERRIEKIHEFEPSELKRTR